MSLKDLSRNEIDEASMIQLARTILEDENKAIDFREIFDRIAALKEFKDDDNKDELIAQFYTDLNMDGSFLTLGSNLWGLKRWYPVEQIEEELTAAPKKKKKKKKAAPKKRKKEEEAVEEDLDLNEEELDFDDGDLDDDLDDLDFDDEDLDEFGDDEEDDDFDDDDDEEEKDKK